MSQFRLRSLVLILSVVAGGCLHSPIPWSPDGKWLAYTTEVRPIDRVLRSGWLFEPANAPSPAIAGLSRKSWPVGYRLWATRADTGVSVLLEDSVSPITAPGWSPDGRALAFGRVVSEPAGNGRFEVVIVEGPSRQRILHARAMPTMGAENPRLAGQAVAWSSDGRYLAVPQLGPDGLAILRADNGRLINTIHDAFLPSWSPDSSKLAFYVRGTTDTLQCIDSALGQARALTEVGQASQAPAWTRDGTSLLIVARIPQGREGDKADLIRVRVDNGLTETVRSLTTDQVLGRDRTLEGVSIAFDRDLESVFWSTVADGHANEICWYHPRENMVYKKFSILDFTMPMGSLSLSPDGRTLAARVGTLDHLSSPALCDLESRDLRPVLIAPDDESRVEWIASMVSSARMILTALPSPSTDPKNPAASRLDRPNLLPIPGEFEANSDATHRLRKIGRVGRPLCDRPPGAPPISPELSALLVEARLFFDYLQEDFTAALVSLENLEQQTDSADRRQRLMGLRVQIFLGQRRIDQAGETIAYLKDREPRPVRRVEQTGLGFSLITEAQPGRGWPDYLALRARALRLMMVEESSENHFNPDAPRPGFGLGLEPGGPRPNILPERPFFNEPNPAEPPPVIRFPRPRPFGPEGNPR